MEGQNLIKGSNYLSVILVVLAVFVGLVRFKRLDGNQSTRKKHLVSEYEVSVHDTSWKYALLEVLQNHDLLAEVRLTDTNIPTESALDLSTYLEANNLPAGHYEILSYSGQGSEIQVKLWSVGDE